MASDKKYGSGGRKQFVRTRVPAAESFAAAVILLLLVVIAAAIYHQGRHFDPNRYAVRVESLKSTAAAVVGKAGTLRAESETSGTATPSAAPAEMSKPADGATATTTAAGGEGGNGEGGEGAAAASTAPAAPVKGQPLEIALPGTKPLADTEFYNADNLFEKIDGRSPAYQNYNVQQLRCRSFGVNAASGSYVDVYEYRFDNPVDAFGMFSLERDPKGQGLDFAPDGYLSGTGYFFRQGAVYVQILASDTKPETLALALAIAQNRAKELPADDTGLAGRRSLPAAGLITDSVAYVPENAQGQSALKDVFQAKYKFNGAELPFFIMVAKPEDTAAAWKTFQDFCARFGQAENLPEINGGKLFRAKLFGKWKIVYQRGGELGGAYDASDSDLARSFVEKYLRGELK